MKYIHLHHMVRMKSIREKPNQLIPQRVKTLAAPAEWGVLGT